MLFLSFLDADDANNADKVKIKINPRHLRLKS